MNAMLRKFRLLTVMCTAVALLLAACAKSSTPSSGGTTGAPSPTASAAAVMIGTSNIASVGTVVTDAQGFTLYHLKTETPGKIVCVASCAGTWPPVLLPSGVASAIAGSGVSGLGTIKRPDGTTQVTYKGMPLYHYSGDTAAGQDNGQGIQNVWFAVTTSASGGPMPTATSSGSSGGYGY
jgi:predicted lipoprotein with Yx(FWY)xxD motif